MTESLMGVISVNLIWIIPFFVIYGSGVFLTEVD